MPFNCARESSRWVRTSLLAGCLLVLISTAGRGQAPTTLWESTLRQPWTGDLGRAASTSDYGLVAIGSKLVRFGPEGDTLWVRAIAGSDIESVVDGGFVAVGGAGELIRLDSNGSALWRRALVNTEAPVSTSDVDMTADGGFIASGRAGEIGVGDPNLHHWLVRTDSMGQSLWLKSFAGVFNGEFATDVEPTVDDGFVVGGRIEHAAIIKLDAQGDSLWTSTYPLFSTVIDIERTKDGGFVYVAGSPEPGIWVVWIDSLGATRAYKQFRDDPGDEALALTTTGDGGILISGFTRKGGGATDGWVIRVDEERWERETLVFPGIDQVADVSEAPERRLWIVGRTTGVWRSGSQIVLSDSVGNELARTGFAGTPGSKLFDLLETDDGGFLLAGTTINVETGRDALLLKIDAAGETVWSKVFATPGHDEIRDLEPLSSGGFAWVGRQGPNGWLAISDATGDTTWTRAYPESPLKSLAKTEGGFVLAGQHSDSQRGRVIVTDSLGNTRWDRTFSDQYGVGWTVEAMGDGTAFVGGRIGPDGVLLKVDPTSESLETLKTYPDSEIFTVVLANEDALVVGGERSGAPWIGRLDLNAETVWEEFLLQFTDGCRLGCASSSVQSVSPTEDGRLVLAGFTREQPPWDGSGPQFIRSWAMELDRDGGEYWSMQFGDSVEPFFGEALAVAATDDGGYAVVGATSSTYFPADRWQGSSGWVLRLGRSTVARSSDPLPESSSLGQNFPNPFRVSTTIPFELDAVSDVRLTLYDVLGRRVATLHSGLKAAGNHEATLDAKNLTPGVYLYELVMDGRSVSRSMMVSK